MTQIDERFLKPHPETVIWWARREVCQACANMVRDDQCGMFCKKSSGAPSGRYTRWDSMRRSMGKLDYCIDAREKTGPCGPDAKLFSRQRSTESGRPSRQKEARPGEVAAP